MTEAIIGGRRVALRVSVGGAVARADEHERHLFARADRAMYAAKSADGTWPSSAIFAQSLSARPMGAPVRIPASTSP